MSYYGAVRSIPEQSNSFSSAEVSLEVRQHPQNALVTPENKEKTRKPIDPPPIVQLKISGENHRNWLVNPFLFMNALLVGTETERGQPQSLKGNQLLGQNVSSLHRLKDIDNKDGGFFVFGDISCRRTGMYRLQFNLFNYENTEVNFLGSVVSQPFRVMTAKEYPGLQESTHLSRTFSDQGVRLRLRKENRNGGVKRTYTTATSDVPEASEARSNSNVYGGGPVHNYPYDRQERSYIKRQRSDSEYTSPHIYPTYASSAMQQYGMPSHGAYGQHHHGQMPQSDASSHMGSMMTPTHPGIMPGWQRSQAPYSAPVGGSMGMSGGSYFGSSVGSGPAPRSLGYSQQTSPQYGGRGSGDLYSGLNSLPTPVSDQGMGSTQSSFAGYGQPPQLSAALPSRGQPVQQYDLSNPSSQYPPQARHYGQSSQQYQTPTSNVTYEPQQTPNPIKAEAQPYGDSPNLYNAPSQNPYPGPEGFSSSDLPLSSGMLNREFSGAYQQPPQGQEPGGYGEMPEQDLHGYQSKSQPAAYPTPHQTSPAQMRDHG